MRRKAWQIAVVVLLMGVLTLLSACGKRKQEEAGGRHMGNYRACGNSWTRGEL